MDEIYSSAWYTINRNESTDSLETQINQCLTQIIDGIDRAKMYECGHFTRIKHPLLRSYFDPEIIENVEIYNCIMDIALGRVTKNVISNFEQLSQNAYELDDVMLSFAQDFEAMAQILDEYYALLDNNILLNNQDDIILTLLSKVLREKLMMPSFIEETIIYAPVTVEANGGSVEDALQALQMQELFLSTQIQGNPELQKKITNTAHMVRQWYAKALN